MVSQLPPIFETMMEIHYCPVNEVSGAVRGDVISGVSHSAADAPEGISLVRAPRAEEGRAEQLLHSNVASVRRNGRRLHAV